MNEIVSFSPDDPSPLSPDEIKELMDAFWSGKSPRTIKAYREDLLRIADWVGLKTIEAFCRQFVGQGPGRANLLAEKFKGWALDQKKWAPAYVNNHLAALRSVVKFTRRTGKITWAIDVDDVKAETYRDTRGPGIDGIAAIIHQASVQENKVRAARDVAILSLFAANGLRRDEVVSLDMDHVDLAGGRIFIKRKKKLQRVWVTIPSQTADSLRAWIQARGPDPGPLFKSYAVRARREDSRLAESSVWAIVREHSRAAGYETRPHGIRHSAITAVLDLTDGNVRTAQRFAGHTNPTVTMKYDDNRKDIAGEAASSLADALEAKVNKLREDGKKG